MPDVLDFESDQFLNLLSDALRAGPGSPQWRKAVEQVRDGAGDKNEYAMLLAARENLESGKAYRQVRPGPGFTRKVMEGVEAESERGRVASVPTPTLIALLAGLIGVFVVAGIGYQLFSSGGAPSATVAELSGMSFTHPVLAAAFNGDVPVGWKSIGSLPLSFDHEMRPAALVVPTTAPAGVDYLGGGIVTIAPIAADQPVALEVTLQLGHGGAVIPQIFISDQPDFSSDRGTSPHELVWTIKKTDGHILPEVVLPDGTFGGQAGEIAVGHETITVRIMLNADVAIIECDGKRLFAAAHQLSHKPRYLGVRLLSRGDVRNDKAAVEAVRVMK